MYQNPYGGERNYTAVSLGDSFPPPAVRTFIRRYITYVLVYRAILHLTIPSSLCIRLARKLHPILWRDLAAVRTIRTVFLTAPLPPFPRSTKQRELRARAVSARSTRWPRPFIPPDGTHYGSQCKQTDNNQEKYKGHEEKERAPHFGKHPYSPPPIPPPVLFQPS
jgi:hypothetical protein